MSTIDLDAYLHRIGYTGPRTPTLDTLRAIQARHAEAIPFENLNPLLRLPVRLDAASLEQKMVHGGRGGYCYELNGLFAHALRALGFTVTGLAARVLWNQPPGTYTPLTHVLLRVEVGGAPYLADVGFGGQTPTGPLRIEPDVEQATPHESFRLARAGDEFILQSTVRGEWRPLYRFDLREHQAIDYEVGNWFVSTHPNSHFLARLLAARPAPGRRYALNNAEFAIHHLHGETERRVLTSAAEVREVLTGPFQIELPGTPELDAVLTRLTGPSEPGA
jgi:N-hydroxyarylamine O-acetyltransferase